MDCGLDIAIEVVREPGCLAGIVTGWQELARDALEANPLYEPRSLLPASQASADDAFECCLVWARDPERSDVSARLAALFPFRRAKRYRGFPASALRSWTHPSWAWQPCTPLVRAEGAHRYVAALLDWLEREGAAVVEFSHVPREGRFSDVLADALREHRCTVYAEELQAPAGAERAGLRNVGVGLGAIGEMWVSMLPLLDRTRRRIGVAWRSDSRALAA